MKVLVTGGSGFIGPHLIPKLLDQFEVYSLERYVTGRYARPKDFLTVFSDLREHHSVRKIIKEIQPDIVIHLASISPVSYSYEHYSEVMNVNLMGTMNLAESCLREVPHFQHFLFASTSETYGLCPQNLKREVDRQIPNSPYAVSKVACENYLHYLHKAWGFPVTILRPFNTYGRKNDYHFVVETTIVQMIKGDHCALGDPKPTRDFLYVDDHVNAYLTCIENPEKTVGEVFNFCTGIGTPIKELAGKIARLTKFKGTIKWETTPPRPLEIMHLVGSYEKAKRVLKWEPKVSLEDGLRRTIEYWSKKLCGDSQSSC